jgi:hypothetical protein
LNLPAVESHWFNCKFWLLDAPGSRPRMPEGRTRGFCFLKLLALEAFWVQVEAMAAGGSSQPPRGAGRARGVFLFLADFRASNLLPYKWFRLFANVEASCMVLRDRLTLFSH